MIPNISLSIPGGYLRPLTLGDLHSGYVDGLNDPSVNRYLEVRREVQTSQTVALFININRESNDSVLFGIFLHTKPNHVGTVRLHDVNKLYCHCYVGICIFDRTVWGCGIGSNALRAVTCWACMELTIHRVEAHAYLDNVASIRSFERAGYRRDVDQFKSYPADVAPRQHAVLIADCIDCSGLNISY